MPRTKGSRHRRKQRRFALIAGLGLALAVSLGGAAYLWMDATRRAARSEMTLRAMEELRSTLLQAKAVHPRLSLKADFLGIDASALRDPASGQTFEVDPQQLTGPHGEDILLLQPIPANLGVWPATEDVQYALLANGEIVDISTQAQLAPLISQQQRDNLMANFLHESADDEDTP